MLIETDERVIASKVLEPAALPCRRFHCIEEPAEYAVQVDSAAGSDDSVIRIANDVSPDLHGRPLPKIEWPTWGGYSVGKWEGETFVVVTTGFNGKTWLDQAGHPAIDAMRLTERFTRKDFGHMELETIVDDPKVYTKPCSTLAQFTFKADTELLEFICEENEKDSQFLVGK